MGSIVIELSDVGILATAGYPGILIELDGQATESPGFAFPEKDQLLVGKAAEGKAKLHPRQILNRFWHQLNLDPLKQPSRHVPENHVEIAFRHLSYIWQQFKKIGTEVVMAVPSFYDHHQLGLILGMAREMSMPVKCLVPIALAASLRTYPGKMLFYVDIHLHSIEVVCLEQGEFLTIKESATIAEKGLIHMQNEWMDTIAQEFVRNTRFDPFHQAASEQDLYDRLPDILNHLQHHSTMLLEVNGTDAPYRINLGRDLLAQKVEPVFEEISRLIERMATQHGSNELPAVLQLSHRLSLLPGCKELAAMRKLEIVELAPGAAAIGVSRIRDRLTAKGNRKGIGYFTSLPMKALQQRAATVSKRESAANSLPTHLLYGNIAYRISGKPLVVAAASGTDSDGTKEKGLQIHSRTNEVSHKHCTIEQRGKDIVLQNFNTHGINVDEIRVTGTAVLKLGQIIRIGSAGEPLQLIACVDNHET